MVTYDFRVDDFIIQAICPSRLRMFHLISIGISYKENINQTYVLRLYVYSEELNINNKRKPCLLLTITILVKYPKLFKCFHKFLKSNTLQISYLKKIKQITILNFVIEK